jgi:uncharacterized membrane protein
MVFTTRLDILRWGSKLKPIKTFAVICAAVLVVTLMAIGLVIAFGDLGLSPHGYIALVLGVILTMALTMVLMGLVFLSDRAGQDEVAFSTWKNPEHREPDHRAD